MAERVDKLPPRNAAQQRYPWDEWLDGSVWELVQGKDFEVIPHSMIAAAKSAGLSRGLTVQVRIRGDRVYVQAQRNNGP